MAESILFVSSKERSKHKNESWGDTLNRATSKKHKKHKRSKSSSDSDVLWVEKKPVACSTSPNESLKRQDWMLCNDFVPTYDKSDIKIKKNLDKPKKQVIVEDKELNPYWKDGGGGLPDDNCTKTSASTSTVGDGGLSWLKRAYQRAVEQAQEENKPLKEIAAERWGSLENFKKMLDEAENKHLQNRSKDRNKYEKYMGEGYNRYTNKKHSDEKYSMHDVKGLRNKNKSEINIHKNLFLKPGIKTDSVNISSEVHSYSSNWKKNKTSEEFQGTEVKNNITKSPNEKFENESVPEKQLKTEILTDAQLNELGAKLLRAELMGNEKLAKELEATLQAARRKKESNATSDKEMSKVRNDERETVILTKMTKTGMEVPLKKNDELDLQKKKSKISTHDEGHRIRYFADDNYSLSEMVKREKMETAEDQNAMFARLAGKSIEKTDEDYTIDDVFVNRANLKETAAKIFEKQKLDAIMNYKKTAKLLDNCQYCLESKHMPKHLIVSLGKTAYLSLPKTQPLTEGHCLIVPIQHEIASTMLDEDVWSEMQIIRKTIVKMFQSMKKDVIFLEMCTDFKKRFHMFIEAIPVDRDVGSMAPIYFKKAILECDSEWANNKKLVDLSKANVRRAIPKGLPYFAVDFGLDGGFAHVIEDKYLFSQYFGKEIIGGMLDLEPRQWRKPLKDSFEDQSKKVLQFTEWYKTYDFTKN